MAYLMGIKINHKFVKDCNIDYLYIFSHDINIPFDFWSNIIDTTNGLDIRFYEDKAKKNELKRDVRYINIALHEVEVYVCIPILRDDKDTKIFCEVGNVIRSNDIVFN